MMNEPMMQGRADHRQENGQFVQAAQPVQTMQSAQPMQQPMQQPLYQAEPNLVQSVNQAKDRLHDIASKYTNHPVRVQTMAGHVHDGVIVNVDDCHLYLCVTVPSQTRGFFNPVAQQAYYYNNVILPLVLYELLVITLLYT
ncbi:MAG: acetyl-CoA acetyltransferase [Paenibacillus sp.]|nr:acetyl-CoA acetyltransferase [Paenibacillus sp.]